jgi:hypothetical protein
MTHLQFRIELCRTLLSKKKDGMLPLHVLQPKIQMCVFQCKQNFKIHVWYTMMEHYH